MKKIDLEKMSMSELKTLRKDVDKAIKDFEKRKRKEAIAAVEKAVMKHGFALSDLLGGGKARKSRKPPKYRHPEQPALTWSGAGRRPKWFVEATAAGIPPEKMEV